MLLHEPVIGSFKLLSGIPIFICFHFHGDSFSFVLNSFCINIYFIKNNGLLSDVFTHVYKIHKSYANLM